MGSVTLEDARDLARRIAGEQLAPRAAAIDRDRTFPWDAMGILGDAGFQGLIVSETEGGLGLGRGAFAAAVAEIAKACASTALVHVSHSAVAKAIEIAGSDGLKRTWLPGMTGGRALGAFAGTAESDPGKAVFNGFKAKLFASETAVEVTNRAIQVLGGHGYSREYVVERLFRDARGLLLHFKTSEWLRQDIAKATLGL